MHRQDVLGWVKPGLLLKPLTKKNKLSSLGREVGKRAEQRIWWDHTAVDYFL